MSISPSPRENYMSILETGVPLYSMGAWDAFSKPEGWPYLCDPMYISDYPQWEPGESQDRWGVTWEFEEGAPGAHFSCDAAKMVVRDIENWREQVRIPVYEDGDYDWSEIEAQVAETDRSKYLVACAYFPGILERFISLMGMEEAMVALIEEPEESGALLDAICDVRIRQFELTWEHTHLDVLHAHDDWGGKRALTMRESMWRELIKPRVKRFYDFVREHGVIISHHSDCFTEPLAPDMVELGISVWQGATPENDIQAVKRATEGKLVIAGGIDASVIDARGVTEEQVRAEVRRAIREYGPGGHFIPCVTSEIAMNYETQLVIDDEIAKADVSVYQ